MVISKQKDIKAILHAIGAGKNVFILGCGECATTCKSGGEEEVKRLKVLLEESGKSVTGYCVPQAPCIAAKTKLELAKNRKFMEAADTIIVLACGLGVQSVKENLRMERRVIPGCDTLFMGEIDQDGNFLERCSACGECILELTGTICPVTRCPKSLLNGPCGGQNKGKCEVNRDNDCVWVMIYEQLKKEGRLDALKRIIPAKDHSRSGKPRMFKIPSVQEK